MWISNRFTATECKRETRQNIPTACAPKQRLGRTLFDHNFIQMRHLSQSNKLHVCVCECVCACVCALCGLIGVVLNNRSVCLSHQFTHVFRSEPFCRIFQFDCVFRQPEARKPTRVEKGTRCEIDFRRVSVQATVAQIGFERLWWRTKFLTMS